MKGAALATLRKAAGLSQSDFGHRLGEGYSRQQVSLWERGVYWPEVLELVFEHVLGVPVGTFARVGSGLPLAEALRAPCAFAVPPHVLHSLILALLDTIKIYVSQEDFAGIAADLRKSLAADEATNHEKNESHSE